MVCGLWFVVCGLWFGVWGLGSVVCGLGFRVWGWKPQITYPNLQSQRNGETHLVDSCFTQFKSQGPPTTCNNSQEGQEENTHIASEPARDELLLQSTPTHGHCGREGERKGEGGTERGRTGGEMEREMEEGRERHTSLAIQRATSPRPFREQNGVWSWQ